jgi:exosortase/archaeosortase family protein
MGGALLLKLIPSLELALFAGGSARLASLFTGAPLLRVEEGWALATTGMPVVVTAACSATGYFLMVAALLGWQFARRGMSLGGAVVSGLIIGLPLSIAVNSLRIVAVMQAHRWAIPLLPEAYGSFLHMLTGVAIFLPALIALNLLLEYHGRHRPTANP